MARYYNQNRGQRSAKYYAALKNVLTDQLVRAFNDYSRRSGLEIYDYLSVDPYTGEVELALDSQLPLREIDQGRYDSKIHDGNTLTLWSKEPELIQRFLVNKIGLPIQVTNIERDGRDTNIVYGKWKGPKIDPTEAPAETWRSFNSNKMLRRVRMAKAIRQQMEKRLQRKLKAAI